MTEDEAQRWIRERFDTTAWERLEHFRTLILDENTRQNLVSKTSIPMIWARHIVDSAQLVGLAPEAGLWIDIGSGGGFPGMVVSILRGAPIIFVEPRHRRAAFLKAAAVTLGLVNVEVRQARMIGITDLSATVVSARAVASVDMLLTEAKGVANSNTVYVFPRGRSAKDEVSTLEALWRGVFHVEQSITDPDAGIVVARDVRRL